LRRSEGDVGGYRRDYHGGCGVDREGDGGGDGVVVVAVAGKKVIVTATMVVSDSTAKAMARSHQTGRACSETRRWGQFLAR
jgi:hypothetical protein